MRTPWLLTRKTCIVDNLIGSTIGGFEILELIGRGGMSSVYLAADKELERNVALKIPHTRFLDTASFVTRFKREAKAMARLRHPNIVHIYSVGTHGEMPFFAMEHVRGESLETLIGDKGALPVGTAIKYILQIARAIEYAHKKGVIHRDIKPANILVDSSGRLLVTDFGVSKMLSDEATKDTVGFVGTPQYMSPEQCGQGTLDHRTDIYSMGAVLFEMLTGQAAFSSDSPAEVIKKQLFDMPEVPAELSDKIPPEVQAIITKMLDKVPENRYPNVRAFLRDIDSLDPESDEPTVVLAPEQMADIKKTTRRTASKVKRNGRKRRAVPVVLACVLAVCAAAFLIAFTNGDRIGVGLASVIDGWQNGEAQPGAEATFAQPGNAKPGPGSTPSGPAVPLSGESDPLVAADPLWARASIHSVPEGAKVFVDSEYRGTTPLTLSEMSPGTYMLAMKLGGYPDFSEEASLESSASIEIFHDFEAAKDALIPKGSLTIDSEPTGAIVYINGEKKGTTRLELPNLRAADYAITLELEGHEPARKNITLLKDENLRISLSLKEKPKYGGLSVHSTPARADVLLNGIYRGSTPLLLGRLEVGTYEVTINKNGYEPYHQELACTEGSTKVIETSLRMTPKFAAKESMIAGDRLAQMGELERAITAYDRAISLDPDTPLYHQKKNKVERALLKMEITNLLSSYKLAYDSENAKLLASLLDKSDKKFFSEQLANAENLFREFDHIDMALSDQRLSIEGQGKITLELHLSLNADYGETGVSAELLNTNRTMVLSRNPKTGWKICAIE